MKHNVFLALQEFVWVATLPILSSSRKPRLVIPAKAGIQTLRANPVGALMRGVVQRERGKRMKAGRADVSSQGRSGIVQPFRQEVRMDKHTEETLSRLLRRAGMEMAESDRERFLPMLDAYMESLERLHSINLAGEEVGGVFRPEPGEDR